VVAKGSGRKSAQWGEGRVAFAALAPEIAKALKEGLPMTKVYALFEARLGMSYRQFGCGLPWCQGTRTISQMSMASHGSSLP